GVVLLRVRDQEPRFPIGPHGIQRSGNLIRSVVNPNQTGTAVVELEVVGPKEIGGNLKGLHLVGIDRTSIDPGSAGTDSSDAWAFGQHPLVTPGKDERSDN